MTNKNSDGSIQSKLCNKKIATRHIVNRAHMLVKDKYGIGNYPGTSNEHPGHDLEHTLMVLLAGDMIYREAIINNKILKHQIIYIRIGGALHDIEQDARDLQGRISPNAEKIANKYKISEGEICNEKISALISREMMLETGVFDESDIKTVESMIMGTKVYIDKNNRIHQAAENGSYLDKILADADLAHLGGCLNFFKKSFEKYLKEKYNGNQRPRKWEIYHEEKEFLEKHEYLTIEAKWLFNLKPINIEFCKNQIGIHRFSGN